MFDFEIKGNVVEVTLENGKTCKIATKWVEDTSERLDLDDYDTIEMWLTDNGYLDNEEQDELDTKAKGAVKNVVKSETPKKKTQRERVVKENPTKELIITTIANALQNLDITNLSIENKAKLITFTLNGEDFKVDLVQKRKPKA